MKDPRSTEPIRSTFSDDPDMAELVEMFVADMPGRVEDIERCWDEGQVEELGRFAHQLKGASAGYGFGQLGDAARDLEQRIKQDPSAQLDDIRREYESLVDLCSRVSM